MSFISQNMGARNFKRVDRVLLECMGLVSVVGLVLGLSLIHISQRPPKQYLKKSLHGRVRGMMIPYDEYERAKKFYVYVFGWDVMRVPQGVFIEDTDERPSLMCATGPSQASWEASQPG